jgi:hypothetical protein
MIWSIVFSSLIGCSFILEEAVKPESAKDSLRYPASCSFSVLVIECPRLLLFSASQNKTPVWIRGKLI